MRLSAKECRSGVVAVETAIMLPVWIAMLALLLLVARGGTAKLQTIDATATVGQLILSGDSEETALAKGNQIAPVEIVDGSILSQQTITIFGKQILIKSTRPVIR